MKYIIQIDGNYYLGKTYTYQYQKFPAWCEKYIAKRYKSKKLAMRVVETLSRNCANSDKYSILEVEE